MLRLRKILLHRYPFYLFFAFGIVITCLRLFLFSSNSLLVGNETEVLGILEAYQVKDDCIKITLKYQQEYVVGTYYFKNKKIPYEVIDHLSNGNRILLLGTLKKPPGRRVENGFSYRFYLKTKKIYYLMNISEIRIISKKKSLYYHIKNLLQDKMKSAKKSYPYLQTFILGNNDYLDQEVQKSFQINGISHLFAISGMHVSLISGFFLWILQKSSCKEKRRYFFVILFLFIYLIFTFSPSILRAFLFFLLFAMNRLYYFYIKPFHLYLVTLTICLLINPYFIYMLGFQYSFLISGSLIVASGYINNGKNYFHKLLRTSILSFFTSSMISLLNFYELNFFSIIYNLFFVPFISFLIFPLSFLTLLFPFLDTILFFFLFLLEKTSLLLASFSFGKIILGKPSIFFIAFYIFILIFCLWKAECCRKFYWFFFVPLFIVQYFLPVLSSSSYLMMFDVGQGDSVLLKSKNEVMLIDTGGVQSFSSEKSNSLVEQVTIPYLKSKGVRKINILVLTHGDYDHLGEAENLIKNFPVENIYINSNDLNYFEERLKKKYGAKMLQSDMTLQVGDISIYSLNGNLKDENDSSIVLLATISSVKVLLMGDASCKTEKEIMSKYAIGPVDVLKVGHHGSKTSSCDEFLLETEPLLALISAGRDNKFKHPHQIVLERFQKRKIQYFITSEKGSIKVLLPSLSVKWYST